MCSWKPIGQRIIKRITLKKKHTKLTEYRKNSFKIEVYSKECLHWIKENSQINDLSLQLNIIEKEISKNRAEINQIDFKKISETKLSLWRDKLENLKQDKKKKKRERERKSVRDFK